MHAKVGRLTDAGPTRLIACADEHMAIELAADRQLKGKCLRAEDRFIVVREADLATARNAAAVSATFGQSRVIDRSCANELGISLTTFREREGKRASDSDSLLQRSGMSGVALVFVQRLEVLTSQMSDETIR